MTDLAQKIKDINGPDNAMNLKGEFLNSTDILEHITSKMAAIIFNRYFSFGEKYTHHISVKAADEYQYLTSLIPLLLKNGPTLPSKIINLVLAYNSKTMTIADDKTENEKWLIFLI